MDFTRRRTTAAIVIAGGMTIVAGTVMPWMTLFAGLHTYRGVIGLYGRLIALGGVVIVALGIALGAKENKVLRFAATTLGIAIFLFSAILLRNVMSIAGTGRRDPMMLVAPGLGLYVCLSGAALVFGSLVASSGYSRRLGLQPGIDALRGVSSFPNSPHDQ